MKMTGLTKNLCSAMALAAFIACGTTAAQAIGLKESVDTALRTYPDLGAVISAREAAEFQLRQARGGYLPTLDFEGRAGAQITDSVTTRLNGDDDNVFGPVQGTVTASQLLFDGFATDAAVERAASEVDAASFRVMSRSEFVALEVVQAYVDIHRRLRVLGIASNNLAFHQRILDDLRRGTSGGAISVADRQQAEERIVAAQAFITETREELNESKIIFRKLVGRSVGKVSPPRSVRRSLPRRLNGALAIARESNPNLQAAGADVDAAYANVKAADARFLPTLNLEARASIGEDLDGTRGRDAEAKAEGVVRWNLFRGGIDTANKQEQIRRVDEARHRLRLSGREVEEGIRLSWNRRVKQNELLHLLNRQLKTSKDLLGSYNEQFKVGSRSLLDLLDTQNSKFNAEVRVMTARYALLFAEYRILASMGTLVRSMGLTPPEAGDAYARNSAKVPATPLTDDGLRRVPPKRN